MKILGDDVGENELWKKSKLVGALAELESGNKIGDENISSTNLHT